MGLTSKTLLAAALLLASTAALAEDAIPGTGGALKSLASDHGILGTACFVLSSVCVTLFTLYMRERPLRDAALAKQSADHGKEVADKDAAHSADRARWFADTTLLQESRLALMREVLAAIHTANTVMNATQSSINERTQTAAEMASQLSALISVIQQLRTVTSEDLELFRKRQIETSSALDKLSAQVAKVAS